MNKIIISPAVFLLLVSLSGMANARSGRVTGSIRDAYRRVVNAGVSIQNLRTKKVHYMRTRAGRFVFNRVRPGKYILRCKTRSKHKGRQYIYVKPGRTTNTVMILKTLRGNRGRVSRRPARRGSRGRVRRPSRRVNRLPGVFRRRGGRLGTLVGSVLDRYRRRLNCKIVFKRSGKVVASVKSRAGRFRMPYIPPGTYRVSCTTRSKKVKHMTIRFRGGRTIRKIFRFLR